MRKRILIVEDNDLNLKLFRDLLTAHGYKRVPMMYLRLVHLPDAARRKELMIIVGDRLPEGWTAASVKEGGSGYAQWPALQDKLVDWATRNIVIESRAGQ